MWEKIKAVTPETWARTICFILALVNQVLAIFGKNQIPFVENDVYQVISVLFTVVTGVVAWWKNNSFTKESIAADVYMNELRDQYVLDIIENEDDKSSEI